MPVADRVSGGEAAPTAGHRCPAADRLLARANLRFTGADRRFTEDVREFAEDDRRSAGAFRQNRRSELPLRRRISAIRRGISRKSCRSPRNLANSVHLPPPLSKNRQSPGSLRPHLPASAPHLPQSCHFRPTNERLGPSCVQSVSPMRLRARALCSAPATSLPAPPCPASPKKILPPPTPPPISALRRKRNRNGVEIPAQKRVARPGQTSSRKPSPETFEFR